MAQEGRGPSGLAAFGVEVIKQHPGPVQVQRAVRVQVPGKHFPQLTPAEQRAYYWAVAVEHTRREAPLRAACQGLGRSSHGAGNTLYLRVGRAGGPRPPGILDNSCRLQQIAPRQLQEREMVLSCEMVLS